MHRPKVPARSCDSCRGFRRLPLLVNPWWYGCIGGSRDTAWLAGNGEQSQRRRPAGGTRVAARPAPPCLVLGGWRGGPAGDRRADWLLVREVSAADCGRYRSAVTDGDHGEGCLPGPYLVGPDARRGVPGDAVRRISVRPGSGRGSAGCGANRRRFGCRRLVGDRVHIESGRGSWQKNLQRREARWDRRRAAVRTRRPGARMAGHNAWRERARRDGTAAGACLARVLLRRRHARVLRCGDPGSGLPVLRAPWLHPAGNGRRPDDGRDLPAVAARNGRRGERRQGPAAWSAVP